FFFSSRRRHTRSKRDWSSDVCSSDLSILLSFIKTMNFINKKNGLFTIITIGLSFFHQIFNFFYPTINRTNGDKVCFCLSGDNFRSEERRVGKEGRCRR